MIYPKCENGEKLYVTSSSQVRPCCWIGERGSINQDPNWNLHNNSIENILNNELKEFVDNLKKDPAKWAQRGCHQQCKKPFTSVSNPIEEWIKVKK